MRCIKQVSLKLDPSTLFKKSSQSKYISLSFQPFKPPKDPPGQPPFVGEGGEGLTGFPPSSWGSVHRLPNLPSKRPASQCGSSPKTRRLSPDRESESPGLVRGGDDGGVSMRGAPFRQAEREVDVGEERCWGCSKCQRGLEFSSRNSVCPDPVIDEQDASESKSKLIPCLVTHYYVVHLLCRDFSQATNQDANTPTLTFSKNPLKLGITRTLSLEGPPQTRPVGTVQLQKGVTRKCFGRVCSDGPTN